MTILPSWIIFFTCAIALNTGRASESADALFAQASRLAETDLARARELHHLAALQYLDEAAVHPEQSGALHYNAGNAFFLAGDLGRSVVAYRQAERELPGSPLVRANLAYVRKQGGNPEEPPPAGWLGRARFWFWQPPIQWLVLAGSLTVFWGGRFYHQWTGRSGPRCVTTVALALTLLMAATLGLSHLRQTHRSLGVLVTPNVVARKGPSFGYEPAFTTALDPGLECEVLRREGDWLFLRLRQDRNAWVPVGTVETW